MNSTSCTKCSDPDLVPVQVLLSKSGDAEGPWSALPLADRAAKLNEFSQAIAGKAKELAELLVLEQGKPFKDAMGEIAGCSAWLAVTSGLKVENEVVEEDENHRVEIQKAPLGGE